MSGLIAKVAVDKTAFHFDKIFDYSVPDELSQSLKPGCRVLVPFGSGNRRRQGIVFSICDEAESAQLKPVYSQLDKQPLISKEMLMLAEWIKSNCFCTLFEAAKLMLPTGLNLRVTCSYCAAEKITLESLDGLCNLSETEKKIMSFLVTGRAPVERAHLLDVFGLDEKCDIPEKLAARGLVQRTDDAVRRVGDATVKMARLAQRDEDEQPAKKLTAKQKAVTELLSQAGSASVKEICYFAGVTQSVITNLVRGGIIELYDNEVYRRPSVAAEVSPQRGEHTLTGEQQKAYEGLADRYRSGEYSTTLLFGITGSGKTSVFMRLIDDVLADGKGVIVMVPEISLTPQTLERFCSRYGSKTAVLHSGLALGQRMDEWKRIKNGDAKLVVGTRSAVFAPFENLGLIIIDEEQEYTYKSESSPRYHAREAAKFRCAYNKAPLVLCSATPSLETYYLASQEKRYGLETLTSRYGEARLPSVDIIDISEQKLSENIISRQLRDALEYNLEHGYQSILLHNRRGYNTFVSCRACGHVLYCESCSVSMTYHHDNKRLMCHHCGSTLPVTAKCPNCGAEQLRYSGQGTQKAEDELSRLFPSARVLRMDADTTMSKHSHADRLARFARGDYDIMIGTQMVAKGLNFEKVTLVGVLMADQTLCCDDFRSYERAFSLLTQVVGRSGRGEFSGRAIIQTLSPENPVFEMAAKQDYVGFYESEIKIRRAMLNPPFSDICMIGFVGGDEQKTKQMSVDFLEQLRYYSQNEYSELPLRVLGPSPASISRVMSKYRYKMLIKCRNCRRMRELVSNLLCELGGRREYKDVTAFADMNPDNVL